MATTNPTDPNKIRLTGENSFIRLTEDSEMPRLLGPAIGGCCGLQVVLGMSFFCRAN